MRMETENREQRRISRRSFLVLTGGIISAISLGSLPNTRFARASASEVPESECGVRTEAEKKFLVAYASKYGSTAGVADVIGKELCSRGAPVDVLLIKNIGDLSSYRGVVVGSAIYKGKWLPEAVEFVKMNREVLRRVPVAYFLVCMTMREPTEENRRKVLAYLNPLLKEVPQVKPVGMSTFAGALHYRNLSWLEKILMKFIGAPEGDFRDWNAIRAWANDLQGVHGLANGLRPTIVNV